MVKDEMFDQKDPRDEMKLQWPAKFLTAKLQIIGVLLKSPLVGQKYEIRIWTGASLLDR
jgi:hypothetical protein